MTMKRTKITLSRTENARSRAHFAGKKLSSVSKIPARTIEFASERGGFLSPDVKIHARTSQFPDGAGVGVTAFVAMFMALLGALSGKIAELAGSPAMLCVCRRACEAWMAHGPQPAIFTIAPYWIHDQAGTDGAPARRRGAWTARCFLRI